LLIDGIVGDDESEFIMNHLIDGEFFVPESVRIPPLQLLLQNIYGPSNDDHDWHEIIGIREATIDDLHLPLWGNKEQLLDNFAHCSDFTSAIAVLIYDSFNNNH
jgi:hypothetical protein